MHRNVRIFFPVLMAVAITTPFALATPVAAQSRLDQLERRVDSLEQRLQTIEARAGLPRAGDWKHLQANLTEAQVVDLLGPPTQVYRGRSVDFLFYSDRRSLGPYVTLRNGVVTEWVAPS